MSVRGKLIFITNRLTGLMSVVSRMEKCNTFHDWENLLYKAAPLLHKLSSSVQGIAAFRKSVHRTGLLTLPFISHPLHSCTPAVLRSLIDHLTKEPVEDTDPSTISLNMVGYNFYINGDGDDSWFSFFPFVISLYFLLLSTYMKFETLK